MPAKVGFSLGLMAGAAASYVVERVVFHLMRAHDIRVDLKKLTD